MSEQNNVVNLEERRQNAKRIGKADLLKGTDTVEDHYFEIVDANIALRPLHVGEWEDIENIQSAGVKLEGQQTPGEKQSPMNMSVDVQESGKAESLARRMIAAKAMSVNGEVWTPEEVAALDNRQLVIDIVTKVRELAGATNEIQEQAKSLREDGRGGNDSPDEPAGVSPSE